MGLEFHCRAHGVCVEENEGSKNLQPRVQAGRRPDFKRIVFGALTPQSLLTPAVAAPRWDIIE